MREQDLQRLRRFSVGECFGLEAENRTGNSADLLYFEQPRSGSQYGME